MTNKIYAVRTVKRGNKKRKKEVIKIERIEVYCTIIILLLLVQTASFAYIGYIAYTNRERLQGLIDDLERAFDKYLEESNSTSNSIKEGNEGCYWDRIKYVVIKNEGTTP